MVEIRPRVVYLLSEVIMKMKIAKKTIILAIAAILFGLSACGRNQDEPDTYEYDNETDYTPYEPEPTPHEPYIPYEVPPQGAFQPEPEGNELYEYQLEDIAMAPPPVMLDGADASIIVNGNPVHGAEYMIIGGGYFPTHVPLLAVAWALGTHVYWNQADGDIALEGHNGNIIFQAGTGDFAVSGSLITLDQPSVVVDEVVYVPIAFFREVFGMNNAMFYGGRVVIDNAEVME